jgi:hypothetical protein
MTLEYDERIHEASERIASSDASFTDLPELTRAELDRVQALHRVVQEIKGLPRVHPPPDFASRAAGEIAFAHRLESARVPSPDGLAATLAARIHADADPSPLRTLEPVRAPAGFAALLASRIAEDATSSQTFPVLERLPRVTAPPDFAARVASRITDDTSAFPVLQMLPRVSPPPHFAHKVASRIASNAGVMEELEEHDRAPLYFIGALLAGVAVVLIALTWPYASLAGQALFETLRVLPESILAPVIVVALLAALGTLTMRRWRLPAALGAFGVAAAFVVPQAVPFFGSAQVSGSARLGSVVRFAGDITVSGEVRGDVIAIGGSVRLEPGARVSGRVLTFLGDVNLPKDPRAAGGVSAVLGTLKTDGALEGRTQTASLPGLSAASALRPFRALVSAGTWQWWYFALLLSLGGALLLLPHWRHELARGLRFEAGRSIGLGVLLLFLTVPAVALGGLSLIGAPFALLIGVFTLLAFSSGAALTLTEFGASVLRQFGVTKPGLWRLLPGYALFGLALLYAPLGITLWLLIGAWGAGALLLSIRQGRFLSSLE